MGLVLAAWSAISSTFVASAFGQFLTTTFLGRLLTSVALSALKAALIKQPKAQQPGIRTQQTQTGGITPASFVLGRYATEGQLAAPTMSHTGEGGGPNAYLTYVIELGDIPGQTLESLILDGEEVPIEGTDHADYGTPIGGRFGGQAWIKYYDGTQTSADPMLVDKYGADPDRPWTVEMVGNGICYAILTFKFKRDVFTSFPSVRFVVGGIPLYDPRKDTSVGGDGTHRWGDVSTWEVSENVAVQTYNIMRGIDLGGGHKWGGDAEAEDLPLAVWWAAMNKADLGVDLEAGGTEPQYRASYEVFVDDEPGGVIEDILRGAVGEVSEVGGVWKIRLGGPSLPIYFFTDDDVIITEDDKFAPFTSGAAPINGVNATYPDPESLWEPRDAPPRFNDTYEAEDGGQRNVGALTLSATPYPTQVQRVMRNYVEDERRFRRHTLTLPSDAVPLEPLDSVSWASERFGYEAKAFEINANVDPLLTGTPRLTLREVDPADENWSTDYELPVALVPTIVTQPTPQTVTGFAVTSWGVPNADGTDVRPALRLSWNGDQPDVRGVQWEIRIPDAALVNAGSTQDVEAGAVIISESILPATNYEVRARFVATRSTAWTPWLAASTPDLKPSLGDLGDDVAQAIADAQALADGVAADLAETEAKAQSVRDDHDALVDGFTKNNLGELEVDYVAAELAATNAETARDQSQAARDAAQNAQSAAEANADAASVSAAAAVDAKDLAETNATNAASAASAAVDAKVLAETNAANAASAASAASSSASAAEAEAIAAAASATTSAGHATTASSEADDAAGSASAAAASATVATTKAGEASTSASNAATSETNAAGSASSAASSETVAAQAGTVSESRAQRNLVGDPSFEHDLAFWAASAGATLSIEPHGQSEPALSKALRFTDADDDAGAYAQPYPVGDFQGRTLRFRFKARSSDAGSFLNVGIARRPEEGGFSGSQYVSVGAVTTTFQDFEVDVIYDALPTYAIGLRWFHSGAPTGAWTEITDVHVEDVTDSLAAEASAAASATSASNAAASETAAGTQASAAQTARTGAETARSGAESAETAAATSASNAAGSESAASTSASNAATSEGNAGSSATAASNSASLASTKATEAGESATAANSSANTATTKAGEASTSASNAATSETNAAGSASSAASSAIVAADAKDDAETAASAASTSASNASASETAAGSSASAAQAARTGAETARSGAETAETNAASSETNAAVSASAASTSASNAATSENNAGDSADAASTSASVASTKATEAGVSATAADNSANVASTKAGEASTSASNAATSETNAAGSASSAASSETVAAQAGTVSESRAQRNLVGDPSFEHDLAFWAASAGATLSIETHGQSEPALSKALRFTDADDDAGAYAQPYPVGDFQGRTLRFRFKARSSDAGSFLNVGIARRPEEGGFSGSQYVSVGAVTTTFQDFEVDVTYDALPTYAIGLRWFHLGAPNGSWTEITDITVEDVTESLAAEVAASAAATSASNASASETAAGSSASAAQTARTGAETARSGAETAETNAATSETNAAGSASAASNSASLAATSEGNAGNSASAASTSAGIATTKANEAGESATTATTQKNLAETAAGNASASASNAASSESNALGSANSASSSASVAASASDLAAIRSTGNIYGDPSAIDDTKTSGSSGGVATVVTHGQTEPASAKAYRATGDGDSFGLYLDAMAPFIVPPVNRKIRLTMMIRSSHAGSIYFILQDDGSEVDTKISAVTTEFSKVSVTQDTTTLATTGTLRYRVMDYAGGSGDWFEITDVHVEDVTDSLAAEASAAASATSASNAAASETAAGTQASAAQTARTGAETARSGAESAETAAATSASNAAGSESAASTSASNAATSEGNAGSSATAASNSASLASTKATEAGESATAANSSANTATTKAGEASTSASNAATSETNADGARAEAVVAQGLAVSAATTAGVYATGNLVFDPDVTDDANFSSSLGATVSVVTHGQSGVPSPTAVKVTDDDSSGGFYSTFRPVGYVEGRTYRLSALVRSNTSSGNVNLALSTNNEAGDNHISLTVSLPDTVGSTFVRVSTDVTITGRTDHNKARLRVGYSGKTSGDWVEATNLRIEDITDYSIVSGEIDDIKALTVDGGTALGVLMTQLDVNAGGVSATIAAQGSAIADLEGNASAVYTFRAKAGGSVGELELVAWDDATGGGSVITMSADTIFAKGLLSADKFAAGNSSNMLFNTDYADGLEHFAIGKNGDAGADTTLEVRAAGLTYTDGVRPTIRLFQDSGDSTGFANVYARPKKQDGTLYYHEVEPGRTYEMSVYVSSQRCTGTLYMIWRDSAGALISSDTSAFGSFFGSTTDPSSWPRRWMKATAPATAKYVDIYIQKSATTSSTTSYMYLHNWMLAQTHGDATQPQDYKPRGTTYIDGQKIITGSITAESGAIGDLAVGTLQIAGDAITVPASAYSYEYFYPASETVWDDLVSVTLNRQGYQTHIEVSGAIGADRSGGGQYGAIAQLRVVRGSTLVSPTWGQGSCFGGSRNSFTLKALDTDTGTGAATYTLQAKRTPEKINTFAPIIVWPSITVQQRKR
ncbi:hypothetical protein DSM107133_00582 [Pseudosulfitobacter sp. DSM 107133]|uniref:phage tail protein n=1 Tax=Pseudosulfitobacter sp. DSM 107133 TaxID=2883100 RepID=UPI001FAC9A10|nr:phage tail protein [Pseudosulfitobacter sp. DSM 107133]UOA25893.1 hypothetical protein DSM107133_00582 [Pseudosulfitobacter sp. DSM 107133]